MYPTGSLMFTVGKRIYTSALRFLPLSTQQCSRFRLLTPDTNRPWTKSPPSPIYSPNPPSQRVLNGRPTPPLRPPTPGRTHSPKPPPTPSRKNPPHSDPVHPLLSVPRHHSMLWTVTLVSRPMRSLRTTMRAHMSQGWGSRRCRVSSRRRNSHTVKKRFSRRR